MQLDPSLASFDVTVVDKQPHFEYIPSLPYAFATEGEFERNCILFETVTKSYNAGIKFVQGLLYDVKVDENMITINYDEEELEDLSYDVLVIATGMWKNGPWKSADYDGTITMEERAAEWKE